MRRRAAGGILMLAGAVNWFTGLPSCAYSQEQPNQPDFVLHSDVRLVLLDVAVKDRHGELVGHLTPDNFTVLENGEAQRISVFSNEDVPVTVGILVDESRSMLTKRNDVLSAADAFIQTSNPRDEVFVLNFNDEVKPGLPRSILFSDNIEQLRAALYRGVPRGRTALNDAVVKGLQQLALGKRGKRALVVISDGGDNASRHTRSDMYAMVENSMATIYTVGLLDATDPDWNPHVLKHLAHVSGGEAFFLKDSSGMTAICQDIAKEIRTRYTIGYQPKPGNHGVLRHIQVRVSAPGRSLLSARTRTSYRYEELVNDGK